MEISDIPFQSEIEYKNQLLRSDISDFLYDNRLQVGTVKRIIGLLGSKIPKITIKKRAGRAKNGDIMMFTGLNDNMLGVLGYEGMGECLGEDLEGEDRKREQERKNKKRKFRRAMKKSIIIHCKFLRSSYIGEGIMIEMGGKTKELKGTGRSFEQSVLALKRGDDIAIRYVDDYDWGVL